MSKFQFTKTLKADLAANGKAWDELLFRACMEAKEKECKASVFCTVLRASGFKCGTGPARTAYKTVRDGGTQKDMVAAITAVKAKRKAGKGTDAGTARGNETLVGALTAALAAAKAGHIEVAETWLGKAASILATAKQSTKQAIEKMGGVALKSA